MTIQALVPMKPLALAKTRLATLLAPAERQALAQAMYTDILGVLRATPEIDQITVVTVDPQVRALAQRGRAQVRPDGATDLNGALSIAVRAASCTDHLLIIFADLPLLGVQELSAFLQRGVQTDVALGAAPDGGTNAMLFRLAKPLPLRFGRGSLARHLAEAAALGLSSQIVTTPGLASDIDRPDDVLALAGYNSATETGRLLHALEMIERSWMIGEGR